MSPSVIIFFLCFIIAQAALLPYGEQFHRMLRASAEDQGILYLFPFSNPKCLGYLDAQSEPIPMRNVRYYRTGGTILLG